MRLLLDENLPKKLKLHFTNIEIYTVREMGWSSVKNGALMQLMIENRFDYFLTFDRNIRYQQNFKKYPICVIILNAIDNEYSTLRDLMPKVEQIIQSQYSTGPIEIR